MKFRDFLSSYLKHNPSDSYIVKEGTIEFEPTAYYEILRKKNPVIFFEHLKGYPEYKLVTNLFGSSSRIAQAIGVRKEELGKFWHMAMNGSSNPRVKSDGAVKEIYVKGDDLNLLQLPAPMHYANDGGRYITAGLVAARDPGDPSSINLTYSRIELLGKDTMALNAGSRGHFWSYLQNNKERHLSTKVSIIIGADPLLYAIAAARTDNEYSKAAALGGIDLTEGIANDIPVPADSEIVIEAEVNPDQEYDEGPFTEYTGYVSESSTRNFGRVSGIMRRKNPIFLDITPSNSAEHVLLSSISSELALQGLLHRLPPYRDYRVSLPLSGTLYLAFGSVSTQETDLSKQLGLLLLGNDYYLKVALVNVGTHIGGLFEYLSNAAANGQNEQGKDIEIVRDVFCNLLDPSLTPGGATSKAIWITRGDGKYLMNAGEDWAELVKDGASVHIGRETSKKHKISILVDPDINPSDEDEVTWSLATRTQPLSDFHFKDGATTIDARKPAIAARRASLPPDVLAVVRKKVENNAPQC